MKKQIVLLAAGASSRFSPFNDTHKSMFTICGKPIIGWTLDGIKKLEVDEVVIVISKSDTNIKNYLLDYQGLNIKIAYQKEASGMGEALLSASNLLEKSFILGFPHFVDENIFEDILKYQKSNFPVGLSVEQTDKPWEFGIVSYNKDGIPIGILEKPAKGTEPSRDRVTGCYLLNKNFLEILKKTPITEYQFEAALDKYMKIESVTIFKMVTLLFH